MQSERENSVCRLCLASCDCFFENVDTVAVQMLTTLGLEFDLNTYQKSVMCKSCSEILQRCFDFKIVCLRTENYISSFRNGRNDAKKDLREIYLGQNGNENTILSTYLTVCRLCMELVTSDFCISLNSETKDVIPVMTILGRYFSELDLNVTKDPVICTTCNKSVHSHFNFIKNCLGIKGRIKEYCKIEETTTEPQIESSSGLQCGPENIISYKNDCTYADRHKNCAENESRDETKFKFESLVQKEPQEFDIKHEVDDHEEMDDLKIEQLRDIVKKLDEDEQNFGTELKSENFVQPESPRFNSKYGKFGIKTEDEDTNRFLNNMLIPNDEFLKTERRTPVHENSSEVIMYSCTICSYRTKRKGHLNQHIVIHKDASEVTFHHCDVCAFKTRHKNSLKQHMLNHRNAEVTTYSCEVCTYTSKQRSNVKSHMLVHKNAAEVTMYSCVVCEYKTRHKGTLKRHVLIHKDASEVAAHQCDICTFQTIHKNSLQQHMLLHKDASELTMYSCEVCAYSTKQRRNLKKHMLIHENASEVPTFSCKVCAYKAKEKGNLNRHMLIHKNTSEVATYSCEMCAYKAKLKGNLEKHMLIHKNASEVTLYSCEVCTYKAKRKGGLKQHMLIHKNVSETTTDQWDMYIQDMTQKKRSQ